jgi:DNA-binding MarR family transcriptional regulator
MASAKTDLPEKQTLVEQSAFLLARLGRVASRRLNEELAATGLKPPQAAILFLLRDVGPQSQQSLGERVHVDPSNLVAFLNALEDEGLLVRKRDPGDRRRHIVEITKQGIKRVPACNDPVYGLEDQLFAGLTAEEREQLHGLLARVLVTMSVEEPPPDGTDGH